MLIDVILILFLAICTITDIRYRKVFNTAIISSVILGLGLNLIYGGISGITRSFLGLVVGFLMLIFFYCIGGVGAGDVKFLAAVGCLKGVYFVVVGGIYGAIVGGIVAIAVLIIEKRLISTVKNIFASIFMLIAFKIPQAIKQTHDKQSYLPYTAFLSIGIALWWVQNYFFSGFIR